MNDTLDQTAQQIADRGHEALVARLRPAFERAAAAHSDLIQIPPDRLEQMIQDAVERADGLQWRRALAGVAVDDMGIELGEALRHPAVARAQEILGVPSYESALDASGTSASATSSPAAPPTPPRAPKAPKAPQAKPPEPPQTPEPPPAEPTAVIPANEPEAPVAPQPEPAEPEAWRAHAEPPPEAPTETLSSAVAADAADAADAVEEEAPETATHEPVPAAPSEPEDLEEPEEFEEPEELEEPLEPADVSVPAVHLGGIANLAPGEEGLELRFAEPGLDIARENDAILGRIAWREIRSVEVGAPGRLRRRRKEPEAKLVIRTERGDASFRIPGTEEEDLRRQLAPALLRVPPQE